MRSSVLGLAILLGVQCGPSPPASSEGEPVSVLAAASLAPAFADVASSLERQARLKIVAGYAASSQLRLQIEQGARADVFASADEEQMGRLGSAGLLAGEPVIFARNRLIVAALGSAEPPITSIADLARSGVRLATAAPSVPIGAYALRSLDAMDGSGAFGPDFKRRVERNVVTKEVNVRQIVAKVELGEADAAIVYATDAVANPRLVIIQIPDGFNVEARYTMAALRDAPHPDLARRFVEYLLSDDGQSILERWGFGRAR